MKRREFLKRAEQTGLTAVIAGSAAKNASAETRQSKSFPKSIKNIVVFFVDQQRQDCIGCYGNNIVQTPNIDRLAGNGIRFNNCYTPAPVCTPARMSFQSGMLAHNHRLMFNTGASSNRGGVDDPDKNFRFFSESLKEKGWRNAHIGKWHIGRESDTPARRGYEETAYYPGYGYPAKHPHYVEYLNNLGLSGFNLLSERKDPTGYREYAGLQEGPKEASIPSYLASQALEKLDVFTKTDNPFYLAVNFWGPHAPYNIPKDCLYMYRGKDIPAWPNWDCNLSDKPGVITRYGEYWKTGWFNEKDLSEMIGEYYGYITLIDEEIGRIIRKLEDAGEFDNTLFIFTADHGSAVGSYRYWDKGFGMYDCITRIPLIISHPSLKPGESDAFVTLCDLPITFMELADCDIPDNVDGSSLMPILTGDNDSIREDHIITEHHGHQIVFWQRMVRTPSFKYIYNPMDMDEFYDLENDLWETVNIIDRADRRKVKWCRERLLEWMVKTGDIAHRWAEPMLS